MAPFLVRDYTCQLVKKRKAEGAEVCISAIRYTYFHIPVYGEESEEFTCQSWTISGRLTQPSIQISACRMSFKSFIDDCVSNALQDLILSFSLIELETFASLH